MNIILPGQEHPKIFLLLIGTMISVWILLLLLFKRKKRL
jgi:Mg2+ and Co2+ transporter CorA